MPPKLGADLKTLSQNLGLSQSAILLQGLRTLLALQNPASAFGPVPVTLPLPQPADGLLAPSSSPLGPVGDKNPDPVDDKAQAQGPDSPQDPTPVPILKRGRTTWWGLIQVASAFKADLSTLETHLSDDDILDLDGVQYIDGIGLRQVMELSPYSSLEVSKLESKLLAGLM